MKLGKGWWKKSVVVETKAGRLRGEGQSEAVKKNRLAGLRAAGSTLATVTEGDRSFLRDVKALRRKGVPEGQIEAVLGRKPPRRMERPPRAWEHPRVILRYGGTPFAKGTEADFDPAWQKRKSYTT